MARAARERSEQERETHRLDANGFHLLGSLMVGWWVLAGEADEWRYFFEITASASISIMASGRASPWTTTSVLAG